MSRVLMVAEKPSLAEAIAFHLSNGQATKRSRALPVYEYSGQFMGSAATFKVTSTTGHIFGCDFTNQFQSWDKTDPDELFGATTLKKENAGAKVSHHLSHEAEGCDTLVLWLDCDREGENICFEVMSVVKRHIYSMKNIWRAKFSAITREEITFAMKNLIKPNKDVSDSVECRQELDLKVGCAFTRFQTQYFQGKYGDLDASVVSYGPCQTPTLGFCVKRHDEIVNFKPESFWRIVPVANRSGAILQFEWERGRVFDEPIARLLHKQVSVSKVAKVKEVNRGYDSKPRPTALNTVELLKVASRALGIGPHHCMQVAEHLYISGYISYPRTESTAYPSSFNLAGTLKEQTKSNIWGPYVRELVDNGFTRPKAGKDMGDHPPITPMRFATPSELSGDHWRIYEYVARHFIATLSPDCKYAKRKIKIQLANEVFFLSGKIVEDPGFTQILPSFAIKDEKIPEVEEGDEIHLTDIRLQSGETRPPDYLSEAELIGLMEKHGIGTDASIPQHINNVCERNYCQVKAGRTIVPTKLGIVLIRGINMIDPQLVLPMVRASIEEYVGMIAEGKAKLDDVIAYSLDLFQQKFRFFRDKIERMDALFEASFSKLASTGKYITRCGNCQRYIRYLEARPQRLYCQTCNVTMALPQNVAVKQYQNFTCPLDGFQMLICHIDGGKSYPLCPNCYINPPFEDVTGKEAKVMACDTCRHPTCMHSFATNYVCDCVDDQCVGSMVFVPRSTGKWKVCCNVCNAMLLLPPEASKMRAVDEECEDCGARMMEMHFPSGKSPLASRQEKIVGCVFCTNDLKPFVQEVTGRSGNFGGRGGRGRGGCRGRGRGGRGRGGGRGRH